MGLMFAELKSELNNRQAQGLYRVLTPIMTRRGTRIVIDGREVINLCSNDYLGLAQYPRLIQAAAEAAKEWGVGSSASRLVSGTLCFHEELERRLAALKGTDTALLFNTGYQANIGIISTLMREEDLVLSDALNHASIVDACRLSRARTLIFRHRDPGHLESLLAANRNYRRKLIITESVFSMDGDIAPLPALLQLADRYDAHVLVDEAHSTGVLGQRGKGIGEHFGLNPGEFSVMGTLSKALGGFGAFLASMESTKDYLVNYSRPLLYTTALPPPVVGAALAALEVMEEEKWRRDTLWEKSRWFRKELHKAGFNTLDSETQIIPVVVGGAEETVRLARRLLEQGVFVQAMRPPTVPPGTSRLRISLTAAHEEKDLRHALAVLVDAAKTISRQ